MNIKELKERIKDLPDNMDVVIRQSNDEFDVSMPEEARVISVRFNEDSGNDDEYAEVECFLIAD